MARIPGLTWRPIARKQRGTMPRPVRVNLHVAVSETRSLWSFFNRGGNPDSHAYVLKDGSGEQYVDTAQHAYCDLQGNPDTISVETQGGVRNAQGEPWTDAQCETLARIVALAHTEHGVPLKLATDSRPGPSSHGVSWHRLGIDGNFPTGLLRGRVAGGLKYSNARGKVCPGDAKIRQIPGILARAKQIAGASDTPSDPLERLLTMVDLDDVARAVWRYKNENITSQDAYAILRQTHSRAGALPSLQKIREGQSMHASKIHAAVRRELDADVVPQIAGLVGAVNALAGGEAFDEAKLLTGVQSAAEQGAQAGVLAARDVLRDALAEAVAELPDRDASEVAEAVVAKIANRLQED